MLLAIPALALLSAPVLAKPPTDLPPGSFRPDFSVRMSTFSDGRGDRGDAPAHALTGGRDTYDRAQNPSHERTWDALGRESHVQAPIKADVALKMQHGDNRDGGASQAAAARSSTSQQKDDRMGRQAQQPPVQLKPQVQLRLQNGDSRESSAAKAAPAARTTDAQQQAKPLSRAQKELLCKQTGVCMPAAAGSDDVEDKTE
jgi:hypothetical protein